MSNFRLIDRDTGFLLPPSVDEWLPERHLARFVVEVIEGLDLRAMIGSYRSGGEAAYHPRLLLAREMGVLQLGTVALDGTKIQANASRHSALSYAHAGQIEAQLRAEVAALLAKAEAADGADLPDGLSIPEELARREQRLAEIARARAIIEARAKERHAREQAEYEAKLAARVAKAAAAGKKPRGRPPVPPVEGPGLADQVNLTDEESRIMPVPGGGFEQCYNAQAVVAAGCLLVVATDVVQAANDKQQVEPMLG